MKTLVIGGAACGKSECAEALAIKCPAPRCYIATMIPNDDESRRRIVRHQQMRSEKGFHTVEAYTKLTSLRLPERGTALLECLGNLTANEMFTTNGAKETAADAILLGIAELERQCNDLIVVTNDVFSDGCSYDESTLAYLQTLGLVNQKLAQRFDRVIEVVCGIPLIRKGAQL